MSFRFSRRQSIIVAILLISIFILASALLSGSKNSGRISKLAQELEIPQTTDVAQTTEPDETPTPGLSVTADFTLNNFHRSEIKDGRKVWEIKAEKGQYYPQTNSADINNATIWLFKPNGDSMEILAKRGKIYLSGTSLEKAEASEQVSMKFNQDLTIESLSAVYNKTTESVQIDGPVKIFNERIQIKGNGLDADLAGETFTMRENVQTIIQPEKRS